MASDPVPRGWHPWEVWAGRDDAQPRFLVDGLIHRGATIVTGRPEAGKTTLVSAAVAAIVRGDESFLGRRVTGSGPVLVAASDPSEADRWGSRMRALSAPPGVVMIAHSDPQSVADLARAACEHQPILFVLDNVLGSITGDVRDNQEARRLLDALTPLDCSLLLVHHSSQKQFEDHRAYSMGPMGSTTYEAWARLVVHVADSGPGRIKVTTKGNDCSPAALSFAVTFSDYGEPVYEVLDDGPKKDGRPRAQDTADERVALALRITEDPDLRYLSQREIGERVGKSQKTVGRALDHVGAKKVSGQGWVIAAPP